jgi:hypothetical protein
MKRLFALATLISLSSPAFAEGPRDAVDAQIAAMAAGDATVVEAAFTEDAGYAYSLDGDLTRGDGFHAWVTSDIAGPGSQFNIESATVTGDTWPAPRRWSGLIVSSCVGCPPW